MMMTRWKLTAGLLGVSLCGLAAMANSSSRSRSSLGCYKAEDAPHYISAPPSPVMLKTQSESIRTASIAPIEIPPVSPPVAVATPAAQLPVTLYDVPSFSGSPSIPVVNQTPSLPGISVPVINNSPVPIDLPLPKVDTLQIAPIAVPSAKPAATPTAGLITPELTIPAAQPPAFAIPVQSKEVVAAPKLPQLDLPKIESNNRPSALPKIDVGIPPAANHEPAQVPPSIPSIAIVPQQTPAPSKPVDIVPVVPSTKNESLPALPGIEFKAAEIAPQATAKPEPIQPLPEFTKAPDVKPAPAPAPKQTPAVISQDDGVKVVVKMNSGRPSLAIISDGAEMMTLTCEQLDLAARVPGEESTSEIKATGKVTFTAPGCQGQCDELVLNPKTWDGTMMKGVRVKCQQSQQETELSADKMTFKLRTPKDIIVPTISASYSVPSKKK